MRASGLSGELRHGYQVAATLGAWMIETAGRAFECRATVEAQHEVWSERRPLDLVLRLGGVEWTWRDVAPDFSGGALVIALTRMPDLSEDRPAASA